MAKKYIIRCISKCKTGEYEMFFKCFGWMHCPEYVGRVKIAEAKVFSTKAEANRFIKQFLNSKRDKVFEL